jgi:hypothetical protein
MRTTRATVTNVVSALLWVATAATSLSCDGRPLWPWGSESHPAEDASSALRGDGGGEAGARSQADGHVDAPVDLPADSASDSKDASDSNPGTCPTLVPAMGDTCKFEGLTCGWGDDPRGDLCRTVATCVSGQWQVKGPATQFCPALQDAGACPSDTTAACTLNTTCQLNSGGACRCTNCLPDEPVCLITPPGWYCPTPVAFAGTGCPLGEPNFGTACGNEGAECSYYAFNCNQATRVCSGGVWIAGNTHDCPP